MDYVRRNEALAYCRMLHSGPLRLLLVEAQAGQGKTALAEQYAAETCEAVAWQRLSEAEHDPALLFANFARACSAVNPALPLEDLLAAAAGFASSGVLALAGPELLASQMAVAPPCTIIIDDVHMLQDAPESLALLQALLQSLPGQVRFMLLMRHALIADGERVFSRRKSLLIDDDLLAFSYNEAAQLFSQVLGVGLASDAVRELVDKTEGWITGLLLCRTSTAPCARLKEIRQGPDLAAFFYGFSVGTLDREAGDGLLLLSLLPEIPQEALELVSAAAGKALRDLVARNFFTRIAAAEGGRTYVLHHLFREALREAAGQELDPATRRAFLARAGEWFLAAGELERGLELIAETGDAQLLSERLKPHILTLLGGGRHRTILELLKKIPTTDVEQDGWLSYAQGMGLYAIVPIKAPQHLERALDIFRADHDAVGELLAITFLIHVYLIEGSYNFMENNIRRSAILYRETEHQLDAMQKIFCTQMISIGHMHYIWDITTGETFLNEALALTDSKEAEYFRPGALMNLVLQTLLIGDMITTVNQFESIYKRQNDSWFSPVDRFTFLFIYTNSMCMAGDMPAYETARDQLQAKFGMILQNTHIGPFLTVWDADLRISQGRHAAALAEMDRARQQLSAPPVAHLESQLLHYRALANALAHDENAFWRDMRRSLRLRARVGGPYFMLLNRSLLGAGLVALGEHAAAERVLRKCIAISASKQNDNQCGLTAKAWLVRLLAEQNREAEALPLVRNLLELMHTYGIKHFWGWTPEVAATLLYLAAVHGIHVDYARKLAADRLESDLLDDGRLVPWLIFNPLDGTMRRAGVESDLPGGELPPLFLRLLQTLTAAPGRSLSVEAAQEALWPEEDAARVRTRLDQLVSRLRQRLNAAFGADAGKAHLVLRHGRIGLAHTRLLTDFISHHARRGMALAADHKLWQAHFAFHRMHDLLAEAAAGVDLRDIDEGLRREVAAAYEQWLAQLMAIGENALALAAANRALLVDPLHAPFYRRRYDALVKAGETARAAGIRAEFAAALEHEGVDPVDAADLLEALLEN